MTDAERMELLKELEELEGYYYDGDYEYSPEWVNEEEN